MADTQVRPRTFDCSPPYYHNNMGVPSIMLLSGVMMLLTFACPCFALVCNAGEEAVKTNECRTCPPRMYQPIPNTTLADNVKCFKKICPPEAIPKTNGTEDPTTVPECICDTSQLYYGSDYHNCIKHKPCSTNGTLTLNGTCVCQDGFAENPAGLCIPQANRSDSTMGTTDNPGNLSQNQLPWYAVAIPVVLGIAIIIGAACIAKKYLMNKNHTQYGQVGNSGQRQNGVPQSPPQVICNVFGDNVQIGNNCQMIVKNEGTSED
ncbi:uncharacterized protein [Haliotis cracherodii]|uniref:uncharacterized protein n=1 Tax=Haliotis cracherodii TaxID=6455 RepID=UPI0039ED9680